MAKEIDLEMMRFDLEQLEKWTNRNKRPFIRDVAEKAFALCDEAERLRIYLQEAQHLVDILNAFDGLGIPISDARNAFRLLRRMGRELER